MAFMSLEDFRMKSATKIVVEGTWILEVDGLRVEITAKKPRSVRMRQSGECLKENGAKVLDWMQETITKARGL